MWSKCRRGLFGDAGRVVRAGRHGDGDGHRHSREPSRFAGHEAERGPHYREHFHERHRSAPDITIGEELNRLPGVNLMRDRGNASQVAIAAGSTFRFRPGQWARSRFVGTVAERALRVLSVRNSVWRAGVQDARRQPGTRRHRGTIDIRTTSPLNYTGPSLQLRAGPSYNDESTHLPHYDGLGYRGSAHTSRI